MQIAMKYLYTVALLMVVSALELRGQETASKTISEPLKTYLQSYLTREDKVAPDMTTKVTTVRVKMQNGRHEYLVYVSGQRWCGSGGCTLLFLTPHETSFRLLSKVTIVQLPIRLLNSTQNGYPDIGVTVEGGGVQAGYEAVLSFNGERYSRNPSLAPARKSPKVEGKVIIANTDKSISLYK